jgi:hypothetical protein
MINFTPIINITQYDKFLLKINGSASLKETNNKFHPRLVTEMEKYPLVVLKK